MRYDVYIKPNNIIEPFLNYCLKNIFETMSVYTVQFKCASESLLQSILLSKVTFYLKKIATGVYKKIEFLLKIVYFNGFDVDDQS